jgi:hypothetical protein
MKRTRFISATLALTLTIGAARAQMTPQQIIAAIPPLPTPEQWAVTGDHTEAFKARMAELDAAAASAMQAAVMSAVGNMPTQADMQQHVAREQQQLAQSEQTMQQMFGFSLGEMADMSEADMQAKVMAGMQQMMGGAMSELRKQMQVLASLGITEADMSRMENMNDAQSEAYIQRRIRENGFSQAEFEKRMREAGLEVLSEEEYREEELRQQEEQKKAEAVALAQETFQEYMTRSASADSLLRIRAQEFAVRLTRTDDKYRALADKLRGEIGGAVESNFQSTADIDVNAIARRYNGVITEWREEAYRIWSEYILLGQEQYRSLMTLAVAADEAKANMPDVTGIASFDDRQRASNNAMDVAIRYLDLVGSTPKIEYGTMDEQVAPMSGGGKG